MLSIGDGHGRTRSSMKAHGELTGEGRRGKDKRRGAGGAPGVWGTWLGAPWGWLLGAAGYPSCSLLFVLCSWLAVREGEEEREEERRGKRKRKRKKRKEKKKKKKKYGKFSKLENFKK
jgi:hypothetical protein